MASSSSPFDAPSDPIDPGMGRPIVALLMVFLVGLACVGLIYAVGEPPAAVTVEEVVADTRIQPANVIDSQPMQDATSDAATSEPYVSPGGGSPMPRHGEAEAQPIPPTQLIDQQALNAQPPQASTLPQPDGPVPWDQAHLYIDRVITVKGTIVQTNNIGNICFLNYDPDWQDKFYIAMFKEAFELLPDPPQDHYLNKTLLVTGKVTLHRDRPQIEVHDVAQVEVLE